MRRRRIGIVGFGHLGKYISEQVQNHPDLELAFVWNRSVEKISETIPKDVIIADLNDFRKQAPDLIVEVCHPDIIKRWGKEFLACCDFIVGSPTAFADQSVEDSIKAAAQQHACYIPAGAFWGGEDIRKMADSGTLQALKVSMTKHPSCFRLESPLKEKNENLTERTILFEGAVRDLCPLAPNNVNTMAAAAVAGHNLGMDGVQCCLIADPGMPDYHVVEVEVWGPGNIADDQVFHVHTIRRNPANPGAVTGNATYMSFFNSLLRSVGHTSGIHLC